MNIIGDLHTHTLASQHAYSTVEEMITYAGKQDLAVLGITDHGPGMLDGAIRHHFLCMNGLPRSIRGIRLVKGAEVNIKLYNGTLDLDHELLKQLDFVIASYHVEAIHPGTISDHTAGWLNTIANPDVNCIGHCGNPVFQCDFDAIISACAEHQKIVEINSNSFTVRPGSASNCKEVARLCMRYQVPVIISSDAHSCYRVGDHKDAIELLESMNFPEELILNADYERLTQYLDSLG